MNIYEQIAKLPPEKRELLELMLQEKGVDLNQIAILPQPRDTNTFPLSFAQQRLWFLDRLEPGSPLYNIPSVLRIKGRLNIEALEKSFNEIIKRHEVLRTVFGEEKGEAHQIILPELQLPLEHIDLTQIPEQDREKEFLRLAVEESLKPFNLATGPLLRVTLLKLGAQEFGLFVTMHHIVSDNWSTGLFVHEIMRLYEAFVTGKAHNLPPLKVQYADFAVWQRKWLAGKTLEKQLDYWRKQLEGIPPLLELPLDKPRPAYQTYNGDFKLFEIPAELSNRLRELSRQQDATLFQTLLAAFFVLLHRYSAQDDICVGSPIANRNRKETEALIGFFVNTLVLRANLSGNPAFTELLQQVKQTTLGAYQHQDLPFEMLVEALQPERDMSHSPLFQVMFVMNNAPVEKLQLPGVELSLVEIENKTTKFDLILNVTDGEEALKCKLEYNTDLFLPQTMDRFIGHYLTLLQEIVARPQAPVGSLNLLTGTERKRLLDEWSQPERRYDEKRSVIALFEEQVRRTPDGIALRVKERQLTYGELDAQANRLARYLLKQGLKKGDIVGVNADRSPEMIVAFLAVLKSGGIYLPLDPDYPIERLEYMLRDAKARFMLTKSSFAQQPRTAAQKIFLDAEWTVIEQQTETSPGIELFPQDSAYVIYTSGSTGQPKGVQVQHGPLANHCLDMCDHYQLSPDDNVLQFAALNFDASIEQILPPLISGATVCMRDNEIWNSQQFAQKIQEYDLTVINPPTAYWSQLIRDWAKHPEQLPENRLRLVIIGGDVFHPETVELWQKSPLKNVRLLNAYGPTETVITATTFEVRPDFNASTVPIGRPRANREVYVLDAYGNPAPVGIPGELIIGGTALAKGYLYRPELSEERFVPNPLKEKPGRVYKTGDRVRFLADGNLEFLGRVDNQVKIRGFRIELGEIEHVMNGIEGIKHAVVKVFENDKRDKILVGYYQTEEGTELGTNDLRDRLRSQLPDYMIPSVFVALETMPIGPGGKINRHALPKPDLSKAHVSTEYVAPRTESEEKLAAIVREILNVERVGVFDNFFELGGHSMMATQVVSRIQEEFGVSLPLRTLFEFPTIDGIAGKIAELQLEEHLDEENDEELSALLDELEDLSEEEVQKLLEEEETNEGESAQTSEEKQPRDGQPRNALETFLLDIWKEILEKPDLTIYDNFFAVGGTPQKAELFLQRIAREFGQSPPPSALMYVSTIEQLSLFMYEYYRDLVEERFGKLQIKESYCQDEKWKKMTEEPQITENDIRTIREIIVPFRFDREQAKEKNKPAVFVLSPPRSGSTLLRVILQGNSHLFAPPEMDLLSFNTMRERQEFFEDRGLVIWLDAIIRTLMEIHHCSEQEAEEILDAYLRQDISTHEFYRRLQFRLNDRILVDKTPSYSLDSNILQRAEASFEQAKYIHLLRHPYAMIYSFIEAQLDQNFFKYEHPFTRRQLAELIWLVSHQNILNFLSKIPQSRKFTLRYEDLLHDPEGEIKRLCDFLEIPFEAEMLRPYDGDKMTSGAHPDSQMVGDYKFYLHRKIDPSAATRWKKFHCKDFLSPFSVELAQEFGYEVNTRETNASSGTGA